MRYEVRGKGYEVRGVKNRKEDEVGQCDKT